MDAFETFEHDEDRSERPALADLEQQERQEREDEERVLRSMIEDPTSDLYYSDAARVMRQDAGIDR